MRVSGAYFLGRVTIVSSKVSSLRVCHLKGSIKSIAVALLLYCGIVQSERLQMRYIGVKLILYFSKNAGYRGTIITPSSEIPYWSTLWWPNRHTSTSNYILISNRWVQYLYWLKMGFLEFV